MILYHNLYGQYQPGLGLQRWDVWMHKFFALKARVLLTMLFYRKKQRLVPTSGSVSTPPSLRRWRDFSGQLCDPMPCAPWSSSSKVCGTPRRRSFLFVFWRTRPPFLESKVNKMQGKAKQSKSQPWSDWREGFSGFQASKVPPPPLLSLVVRCLGVFPS